MIAMSRGRAIAAATIAAASPPLPGMSPSRSPSPKGSSCETAITERSRRRESSVGEALIKMYLAVVSVRRVEDISPQGDTTALNGKAAKACLKIGDVSSGEGFGAAGKQFFRRNPDGFQGKIAPSRGQKARRLGMLTCFKHALIPHLNPEQVLAGQCVVNLPTAQALRGPRCSSSARGE